jgi:hypothetical protein
MLINPSPINIKGINIIASESSIRFISTNPIMLRMMPPDDKIIPTILLVFTGSFLAIYSKGLRPMNHAIGGIL